MSKITLTVEFKRALKSLFIDLERWLRNLFLKENEMPLTSKGKEKRKWRKGLECNLWSWNLTIKFTSDKLIINIKIGAMFV